MTEADTPKSDETLAQADVEAMAQTDAQADMAMETMGDDLFSADPHPEDAGMETLVELQDKIAALEAERDQFKAEYLRALADSQNAKRMAEKRIQDNTKYAVSNFAKSLLGVADNLQRALLAAPPETRDGNQAIQNLAVGVEMTEQELSKALEAYHVSRVPALHQPFDPNFHQAVQEVENTTVPTGTVVQVYQEGYVMHDRLLRPAMVVVSKGGPKRAAEEAPQTVAPADKVDRTI